MGSRNTPIEVPIIFTAETRQAATSVNAVATSVAGALRELEAVGKQGGVGQLAAGQEKLRLAGLTVAALGNEAIEAAAKLKTLRAEAEQGDLGVEDWQRLQKEILNTELALAETKVQITEIVDASKGLDTVAATRPTTIANAPSAARLAGGGERQLAGLSQIGGLFGGGGSSIQGLNLAANVAGAVDDFKDLQQTLPGVQGGLKGVIASSAATVGALALVAIAFNRVQSAYKESVEDATAVTDAFLGDVKSKSQEALQTTAIDLTSITSIEQLQQLREEQALYSQTLQENIDTTQGFIDAAENSNNALLRVADTLNLGQYEDNIKAASDANKEYSDALSVVDKNLELLTSGLVEVSVAAREAASSLEGELSLAKERTQLLTTGTTEELDRRRQEVEISLEATNQVLEKGRDQLRDLLIQQIETFFPEIGELLQSVAPEDATQFLLDTIAQEGVALAPGIQELITALDGLEGQTDQFTQQLDLYNNPLLQAAIELRESEAEALEASEQALEDAAKTEEERKKVLADATQNFQKANDELNKIRADEAARVEAQRIQVQRDGIEADYRRQIDAAQALEAELARNERIAKIRADGAAQAAEIDAKYQEESNKAFGAYQRNRLRAEQDLNGKLKDATLENDVNAFIAAQEAGSKELDRLDEDYQLQQDERREQAEKSLAQLQRQLMEREQAEQSSQSRRLTRSQQLEQEFQRIRENWKVQDEQRQLQIQQQAAQARVQLLNQEMQAAADTIISILGPTLRTNIRNLSAAGAAALITSSVSSTLTSIGNAFSFAEGGVADQPTIARFGDKPGYSEAFIPFRKSEGIEAALDRLGMSSKRPNVTIYQTVQAGEIVKPSDLDDLRQATLEATYEALGEVS